MSHFTTVETRISDLACLTRALDDLGLRYEKAGAQQLATVRGWRGSTQQAELSIRLTDHYDVGVRRNADGTYAMSADWWAIEEETGQKAEALQQRITQRYAYRVAVSEAERQGFTIDEEAVDADGTIRLSVSRW